MIDQDGDGRVTESDLKTMLSELGEFSWLLSRLSSCPHIVKPPLIGSRTDS